MSQTQRLLDVAPRIFCWDKGERSRLREQLLTARAGIETDSGVVSACRAYILDWVAFLGLGGAILTALLVAIPGEIVGLPPRTTGAQVIVYGGISVLVLFCVICIGVTLYLSYLTFQSQPAREEDYFDPK